METDGSAGSEQNSVKEFFSSWYFWRPFISVIIGGGAGFIYYYFLGCTSGTCPITSTPFGSIITGSLLGYLLGGSARAGSVSNKNEKI